MISKVFLYLANKNYEKESLAKVWKRKTYQKYVCCKQIACYYLLYLVCFTQSGILRKHLYLHFIK